MRLRCAARNRRAGAAQSAWFSRKPLASRRRLFCVRRFLERGIRDSFCRQGCAIRKRAHLRTKNEVRRRRNALFRRRLAVNHVYQHRKTLEWGFADDYRVFVGFAAIFSPCACGKLRFLSKNGPISSEPQNRRSVAAWVCERVRGRGSLRYGVAAKYDAVSDGFCRAFR